MIAQGGFLIYKGQEHGKKWSLRQTGKETVVQKPSNTTFTMRTKEQPVVSMPSNSYSNKRTKNSLKEWKPFNTTNPHVNWCPLAGCQNSPMCTPCQRRFLLIIATGRSGSTSLLRMMNLLPGVRLSGENNNELNSEKKALDNLWDVGHFQANIHNNAKGAWAHNAIPDGSLSCPIQQMFEALDPPEKQIMLQENFDDSHEIIGFKTVRFHIHNGGENLVKFVKNHLPCTRVLVNFRSDVQAQFKSRAKVFNDKRGSAPILVENEKMKRIAELFGKEYARILDMSNWTKPETGLDALNHAVEWLGFQNCKFNRLYHENNNGYQGDPNEMELDKNCHYSGKL